MNLITKPPAAQSFTVTPIKPAIGAEITGIDLTRPIDEATRKALYQAVVDNIAVVIKDQHLDPAQFAAAMELFGELMPDQIQTNLAPGVPMVSILDNFQKDSKATRPRCRRTPPGIPTTPTKSCRPSSHASMPLLFRRKAAARRWRT